MELLEFWCLSTGSALLFDLCIKVPSSISSSTFHIDNMGLASTLIRYHANRDKHTHREHQLPKDWHT